MIHSEYVNLILKYDYIKSKWKITYTVLLFHAKYNA
jgi:hypothetical protein